MVWLGIDVGQKRSGVAISESGVLTRPLFLLEGTLEEQISRLLAYLTGQSVDVIVLGQPPVAEIDHPTKQFAHQLRTALRSLPVAVRLAFVDETLTSKEAERRVRFVKQTDTDLLAAQLILEQYFNEQESHAER